MIFRKILSHLPRKEIGDSKGNVFFWRYTIVKTRWGALYLHEFCRGDMDRCLHDHPWPFVSIVLRGGYWEQMPSGLHWRRPGSILIRPAGVAHRVNIEPGRKAWSLVFVGRKVRSWGFYTVNGWRPWSPGFSPICETESQPDA